MRMWLLAAVVALVAGGCSVLPPPKVSLGSAEFAEGPYLVKRGPNYYLHYRMALEKKSLTLRRVLVAKRCPLRGYYYLSGAISHPEWGGIVERPLAYDGFTEFAKWGMVYWLDPDGTETGLEIREVPE